METPPPPKKKKKKKKNRPCWFFFFLFSFMIFSSPQASRQTKMKKQTKQQHGRLFIVCGFSISVVGVALPFSLPPSCDSDPGSQQQALLHPSPLRLLTCTLIARRLPPSLPWSTRVKLRWVGSVLMLGERYRGGGRTRQAFRKRALALFMRRQNP